MNAADGARRVLALASVTEALTGLGLLAAPSVVVKLLLSAEIVGAGIVASRVAGIALIALGVACWPTREVRAAVVAMLGYNLLVAIYLVAVGLGGEMVGVLLWPAAAVHALLVVPLLISAMRNPR